MSRYEVNVINSTRIGKDDQVVLRDSRLNTVVAYEQSDLIASVDSALQAVHSGYMNALLLMHMRNITVAEAMQYAKDLSSGLERFIDKVLARAPDDVLIPNHVVSTLSHVGRPFSGNADHFMSRLLKYKQLLGTTDANPNVEGFIPQRGRVVLQVLDAKTVRITASINIAQLNTYYGFAENTSMRLELARSGGWRDIDLANSLLDDIRQIAYPDMGPDSSLEITLPKDEAHPVDVVDGIISSVREAYASKQ